MSRVFGEDLSKWLIVRCKLTHKWRLCPPVDELETKGGHGEFRTFEDARKRFTEGDGSE